MGSQKGLHMYMFTLPTTNLYDLMDIQGWMGDQWCLQVICTCTCVANRVGNRDWWSKVVDQGQMHCAEESLRQRSYIARTALPSPFWVVEHNIFIRIVPMAIKPHPLKTTSTSGLTTVPSLSIFFVIDEHTRRFMWVDILWDYKS